MMQLRSRRRRGSTIEFRRRFRDYFLERLAFRLLEHLERSWQGFTVPRLAAFPADELGRQIAVRGLAERDSLLFLFDDILAANADDFRSKVAIDIGANVGNHALFLAPRFARVLAFEPHPLLARLIELNAEINDIGNVRVHPVGLSDVDGEAAYLEIAERNIGASGLAETHWSGGRAAGRTLTVRLEVGDEAITPHAHPDDIGLIKIDVEGHEENVIKGLELILTQADPIVLFEVRSGESLPQGLAAWALLESFGYRHFHVIEQVPVLLPWAPAPLRWGVNLVDRMARGVRYRARRIERFQPCQQDFIIAAKRELL